MSKLPVSQSWFNQIYRHDLHRTEILRGFEWLKQLDISVSKIANFGCWGSDEPFALLWTLDATEVVVVEKEERHLSEPKERLETLRKTNTDCMDGRRIEFITADMSIDIAQLPSAYFDLSYCEEVLCNLYEVDPRNLQAAIIQMARITRSGGLVIAVESKVGVKFTTISVGNLPLQEATNDPVDINLFFEAAGLVKAESNNMSAPIYCYRKG
jgi:SAM-dependent methyltransferase